jgi:hypothetical protein
MTEAEAIVQRQLEAYNARDFDGAPSLHAKIVRRIAFDRFVVDHERVTGVPEGVLEAVVTYEVVGGRIANAWFLLP